MIDSKCSIIHGFFVVSAIFISHTPWFIDSSIKSMTYTLCFITEQFHAIALKRRGIKPELRNKNSVDKSLNVKKKWHEIYCRIGINTNNMIVGNMGSTKVLDYTVMGDAVNLASRLKGQTNITELTYRLTEGKFKTRIVDYVRVKGKTEPVLVYEIYGKIGEGTEYKFESNDNYYYIR